MRVDDALEPGVTDRAVDEHAQTAEEHGTEAVPVAHCKAVMRLFFYVLYISRGRAGATP